MLDPSKERLDSLQSKLALVLERLYIVALKCVTQDKESSCTQLIVLNKLSVALYISLIRKI